MTNQESKDLLKKYIEGKCDQEETAWVESWYLNTLNNNTVPSPEEIEAAYTAVRANLPKPARIAGRRFYLSIAATILLCVSVAAYLAFHQSTPNSENTVSTAKQNDLPPGSNKAILTLGNGQRIILTGASNGKIAQQGNVAVSKTAEGQIVYNRNDNEPSVPIYNTTATPRGGEYHLILADGTNVWLNAASSITYPTAFTGHDRTVQVTGEVYFEVSHDQHKPFKVITRGQTVEVLGTHFNINAYDDEPVIKTTLFEGAVKVSRDAKSAMLKPGEQAVDNTNSSTINVTNNFNSAEVIAWKNGKFYFDYSDIHTVMRQIARWYDVDVVYQGKIPAKRLSGSFSKYTNASKALSILEYAGIDFKIEGRRIIVK
jgi:ferric-dicitrate binding protein FerR (iron transport regulator)